MRLPLKKNNQPSAQRLSDAPGDETDRELARQMADGSREALARFVDRHISYLYRHLQRRLGPGNDMLIEEVVRATFGVAFGRLRPYVRGSARTPMRLWLVRLTERELGRRKAAIKLSDESAVGEESEELTTLRETLAALPRRQEAAVCMALFDGMASEEIAGALGVRQARAMRLLRSGLRRTGSRLALAHAEVG